MMPVHLRPDAAPWGDGLDDDGWSDIASVSDWQQCTPDEYIRVFPRLVPADGDIDETVRVHLADVLGRLKVRSNTPASTLSGGRTRSTSATRSVGRWRSRLLGRVRVETSAPRTSWQDTPVVDRLATLVRSIDQGRVSPFSDESATLVAFHAGLHPAYIWPAALCKAEYYTAIGWLGHLHRRGRAFMPRDVAEFLVETAERSGTATGGLPPTPPIEGLGPSDLQCLRDVIRCARARLQGTSRAATWPNRSGWWFLRAVAWPRAREVYAR